MKRLIDEIRQEKKEADKIIFEEPEYYFEKNEEISDNGW